VEKKKIFRKIYRISGPAPEKHGYMHTKAQDPSSPRAHCIFQQKAQYMASKGKQTTEATPEQPSPLAIATLLTATAGPPPPRVAVAARSPSRPPASPLPPPPPPATADDRRWTGRTRTSGRSAGRAPARAAWRRAWHQRSPALTTAPRLLLFHSALHSNLSSTSDCSLLLVFPLIVS